MEAVQDSKTIVHMVGSVPLDNAEAVFRTLAETVGAHMERIPDGETGRRRRWISFINDQLKANPDLEIDAEVPIFEFKQWDSTVVFAVERLKIKDSVEAKDVVYETGYADDAIRNFEIFARLQAEGAVPGHVKYQICMATPLAIAYNFISPNNYDGFIPAYTNHLAAEFARIAENLPAEQISYQWDVCQEVLMWEGYYEQYPGFQDHIFAVLGGLGDMVPAAIDVGYHLCYGSPADEHMGQPKDMAILVEIANGIAKAVSRPVQYIHLPVPVDRGDDAYFEPLSELWLGPGTDLYLGLVHDGDGPGNAQKLAAARRFARVAGIAAECGVGRIKNPETLPSILEEHRRLAQAQPHPPIGNAQ